jgi:predicted O-methyltransferase YrrM
LTSRELTGLLPLSEDGTENSSLRDWAWRLTFGAIGWPWLLMSLHGGSKAAKRALVRRLGLAPDALPHLGSWKADTALLHRIVDMIEVERPACVVELGAGASSLVAARALALNGGGQLTSFDQHAGFVAATREWLADNGVQAAIRHAPLTREIPGWPGRWYALDHIPARIDMLIIDGPPWAVHPMVRGAAETLFSRLAPGAIILLDDAARPGERLVARRWRRDWPELQFRLIKDGTKGTLVGRKPGGRAETLSRPDNDRAWVARAAAILLLIAGGWVARDQLGPATPSVEAASGFVDKAAASYQTSLMRAPMRSQVKSTRFDRREIAHWTGLKLPDIPAGWRVRDVQVYPGDATGPSVEIALTTAAGEPLSLFASRAETPADGRPLLERRQGRSIAYWEVGVIAYAVIGEITPARALALAAEVAG